MTLVPVPGFFDSWYCHPLTKAATAWGAATDLSNLIAASGHEPASWTGRHGHRDDLKLGCWPTRQIQLISQARQMYL
jgi:hypothetical protein